MPDSFPTAVPAWGVMWSLGVVVYFAVKGAMAWRVRPRSALNGVLFFFTTPTLDPKPFRAEAAAYNVGPWWRGIVGLVMCVGVAVLIVPLVRGPWPWFGGLLAMAGVVGALHFGVFEFLVALHRKAGRDVRPLMNRPWAAVSLAEFWGRRWNVPFRDAATELIVKPMRGKPAWSVTLAVFFVSGMIHDVVMSMPVSAGWGGPTAYFLIQAAGLLLQKTTLSRAASFDQGRRGWLFVAAVVIVPLPLLFHQAYCVEVMLPFYDWVVGRAGWDGTWSRRELVLIGGGMQWAVLIASACVPFSLDWRRELAKLPSLLRQMFWVYGGYVGATIVALAAASVLFPDELAGGGLGRALAGFTALFWGVRLLIGWCVFDAEPFLDRTWKRVGYELLHVNFALLTLLYLTLCCTPGIVVTSE